jgi:hypothetical protein
MTLKSKFSQSVSHVQRANQKVTPSLDRDRAHRQNHDHDRSLVVDRLEAEVEVARAVANERVAEKIVAVVVDLHRIPRHVPDRDQELVPDQGYPHKHFHKTNTITKLRLKSSNTENLTIFYNVHRKISFF